MTRIQVRPARPQDATGMVAVLNPIIAAGGSTAIQTPVTSGDMAKVIATALCCHVATGPDGEIAGMQWLEPDDDPAEAYGYSSTFARRAPRLPGVGRALFVATCRSARAAKLTHLIAVIRADNVSGLGYYAKMGFEDHDVKPGVPLKDGTPVDRIVKRFTL